MISKKEFKITVANKQVKIGTWTTMLKPDFDANQELAWKNLRDKLTQGKKDRFKNFRDAEKTVEDYAKVMGGKKSGKEYFIGLKMSCQYKNYKGYLLEQRDKVLELLYQLDKELGIKSAIK